MDNYSFILLLDYVINSIGTMNINKYENYVEKNPHIQHYFDALCELYDILEFYPDIQNDILINNYEPSSLQKNYFQLRKYCFSNDISGILNLQKLPNVFNNNYLEIFYYYEKIISRKYKEEKTGYDDDNDEESKEE